MSNYSESHNDSDNVATRKDMLLLQADLKENYTRNELLLMAKYFAISPHLNTERLTMELAKANYRMSIKKASMTRLSPATQTDILIVDDGDDDHDVNDVEDDDHDDDHDNVEDDEDEDDDDDDVEDDYDDVDDHDHNDDHDDVEDDGEDGDHDDVEDDGGNDECSSDSDCELKGQSVICVTKRNGRGACVFET